MNNENFGLWRGYIAVAAASCLAVLAGADMLFTVFTVFIVCTAAFFSGNGNRYVRFLTCAVCGITFSSGISFASFRLSRLYTDRRLSFALISIAAVMLCVLIPLFMRRGFPYLFDLVPYLFALSAVIIMAGGLKSGSGDMPDEALYRYFPAIFPVIALLLPDGAKRKRTAGILLPSGFCAAGAAFGAFILPYARSYDLARPAFESVVFACACLSSASCVYLILRTLSSASRRGVKASRLSVFVFASASALILLSGKIPL